MTDDEVAQTQALSILFSAAEQSGIEPQRLLQQALLLLDYYESSPHHAIRDIEATKKALNRACVEAVMN